MEKRVKNILFAGIVFAFIFSIINFVYAVEEKCPILSNYVERVYSIHKDKEDNYVEFEISATEQLIPVYIYINKPLVQQMFVVNLTQKKDGRYFDRVRLNLKDTIVSEIYLDRPGIHTLLITTDPYYYREDISNLCMPPYPCNVSPHPCNKTDRILTHIKVISKERNYGIMYKLLGLKNISENISYFEKPIVIENIGNFTEEYNWKLFLLSNSSAVDIIMKSKDEEIRDLLTNATEIKKTFTRAVVVEGTVYNKDANPVKGAVVAVYLVGIEPRVIHIMTITDEEGRFKIYHEPAGDYIYRLPKIMAFNPYDEWYGVVYEIFDPKLAECVDMSEPPELKIDIPKDVPFPVVETLIAGLIIGGFLIIFGTGYLEKIIDAFAGKKEHKIAH